MTASGRSPIVYAFPAIALAGVLLYFLYGAVDQLALDSQRTEARVIEKQIASGSTTYNTNVTGGRAWSDSTKKPDAYIVVLQVDGEATGAAVTPQLFESLRPGDLVRVEFQRTRLSRRIVVTDVRR
jgi:hypothetical protein